MPDYILLMHADAGPAEIVADWGSYLGALESKGVLRGGSAIGGGRCFRRGGDAAPVSSQLAGYIRIVAPSLEAASDYLKVNPVYEAGGTVEIRELPQTG